MTLRADGTVDSKKTPPVTVNERGPKTTLIDFFFQAEDGIRKLEGSRGLGDVNKRQLGDRVRLCLKKKKKKKTYAIYRGLETATYKHLTRPTIAKKKNSGGGRTYKKTHQTHRHVPTNLHLTPP